MKFLWLCGHYVGPPQWRFSGDWVFEPDECGEEFETEHTEEELEEEVITATCPKCGAELTLDLDWPERVE